MGTQGTVLITGASRGLGLEFVRQYHAAGWEVIALCRDPNNALDLAKLGVECVGLDVSDFEKAAEVLEPFGRRRIDILLNNAGIMDDRSATAMDADVGAWCEALKTNAIAPAVVTRLLLPSLLLSKRPVAATMGSLSGLFAKMTSKDLTIYRSSKAAAHAVTISLGYALKDLGVIYVSLRPGPTKTDMTRNKGAYSVPESVKKLRGVLAQVTLQDAGRFVDRTGRICSYETGDLM